MAVLADLLLQRTGFVDVHDVLNNTNPSELLIDAGTYTPTLTSVSNIDSTTVYALQYMRIGSIVNVAGRVDIDATSATTLTRVGVSLPVTTNFTSSGNCGGGANALSSTSPSGAVWADTTNDRAEIYYYTTSSVVNMAFMINFTYQII